MAVSRGAREATSLYETKLLKSTHKRPVDFERINLGAMRFRADAVSVPTGTFVYFDNSTRRIRPEYAMVSDLPPPGFPAGEIEGEYCWDGGLIPNMPLQVAAMVVHRPEGSTCEIPLLVCLG